MSIYYSIISSSLIPSKHKIFFQNALSATLYYLYIVLGNFKPTLPSTKNWREIVLSLA